MQVAVGTFNLNNLFSRFDFEADLSTAAASDVKVEEQTSFSFDDPGGFKLRTYLGKLVKGKPDAERKLIATRIKHMDLDVLAVQEDGDNFLATCGDELQRRYESVLALIAAESGPGAGGPSP